MVNWENYEEYMLLDADGELNEAEQNALQVFIGQHPELQKEYELYKMTILAPDTTQVYEHKQQLLKEEPKGKTIAFGGWWAYGAAAGIAAIIGIWALKPATRQPALVHTTTNNVKPVVVNQPAIQEQKELHSPVKTITTENQPTQEPTAIAKSNKAKTPKANTAEVTQPVTEPKVLQPLPAPETIANVPRQEKPVIVQEPEIAPILQPEVIPAEPKTIETKTHRENRDLLAILDIDDTRGISEFRGAVAEKLEKAKDLKNKIKGTDVSLKLGKKELFVLKF